MLLAGITVELVPIPSSDYYPNFMMVKDNAVNGEWDLALCGWSPDWAGGAARSVFQPQFQYLGIDQSYNYTNYNNDAANAAMAEALAAPDAASAEQYWIAVNDAVMADPPVIPLYSRLVANVFGPDVVNYQVFVLGQNADWSNVDVNR
jgi:peptide/nickel transport system substrate-binding protein